MKELTENILCGIIFLLSFLLLSIGVSIYDTILGCIFIPIGIIGILISSPILAINLFYFK